MKTRGKAKTTHLQILHKVIKYPQALGIFTLLDIDKGANFRCLMYGFAASTRQQKNKGNNKDIPRKQCGHSPHEFRALVSRQYSSLAILSRLPCVVEIGLFVSVCWGEKHGRMNELDDLTRLHDALEFLHNQWADPHYQERIAKREQSANDKTENRRNIPKNSLSFRIKLSFR